MKFEKRQKKNESLQFSCFNCDILRHRYNI